MRISVLLASIVPLLAANAGTGDAFHRAMDREIEGDPRGAAIDFHQALRGGEAHEREEAEVFLARALARLGLPAAASAYYLRAVERGPSDPYFARAVEGAVAADAELGGALAPALEKVPAETAANLSPETAARLRASLALSAYSAGRTAEAVGLLERVPAGSPASARAQYLSGLSAQRSDPEKALRIFRALAALDEDKTSDDAEVKQLAQLAVGRTLYALRRYREASAAYAAVPRFSRHWTEALFEGAYADLRGGDPGAALGKLHSLRSPQLLS